MKEKVNKNLTELKITGKEQRAMILGALSVILPIALLLIGLYFGAFLLIYLWF